MPEEKEENIVQNVLNLTIIAIVNLLLHSYKFPHRLTYSELSGEQGQQTNPIELLEKLVGAIASNFSAKNPIQVHQQLAQVEENKWLLTTTEVKELAGRKPLRKKGCNFYQIGGWKFVSVGKSGNQLLWRVEKLKFQQD